MKLSQTCTLSPPSQNILPKLPHKNKDLQRNDNGSMIMNERNLKIICENEGLYQYPEMNNKIYLHFKVIQKIQNLDKYVNLRTIYLQNNVISKIENLDCLIHLQNLFLQNNMIKKIENLQKLKQIKVINLSNNNVFKIEGLSQLPYLQNLSLSNNYLTQFQDLEHLGQCTSELTSIDLSNNHIKPNADLLNFIPQVKCLYLSGNPLVRQTKHYRRVVVGTLKNLLYLDQRGIDKQQRMLSQAWIQGGQKAFKQAKQKVQQHRQLLKNEKRQEIMKDIDVHRNRKIQIFLRNIKESQQQIQKLRGYIREKGNEDMGYFYQTKIAQLYEKIRQNQEFVNNINKRIGAAAKSISSGKSINSCNESQKSICSQQNKSLQESKNEYSDSEEEQTEEKSENKQFAQKQMIQEFKVVNDLTSKSQEGLFQKDEINKQNVQNTQQNEEVETDLVRNQFQFQSQTNNLNYEIEGQTKKTKQKKQINLDENDSQISFSKTQHISVIQEIPVIQKKVIQLKKMTPAPSTGLDELD